MKKTKYSAYFFLFVCTIIFTGLTSCSKDDNSSSSSSKVELLSFGPCPIPRGGELRIIGTNLDKVESVVLPGSGAISDINRVSNTEIKVIVPQSTIDGKVVLKTGGNDVTSITDLVIDETIKITAITPLVAKGGDVVKIEGDYLDKIETVVFETNKIVLKADFKSQAREAIEVAVPLDAQTGKVGIGYLDPTLPVQEGVTNYALLFSEDELTITLPAITMISPNPIKTGNVLTIEGTDFDLVDSLSFAGDVGTRKFVSKTTTKIEVKVPVNANKGVVKIFAFSGIGAESIDTLKLVAPAITSISPNPVKNGATLTIKGTDLDLVSDVIFGGSKNGTINAGGSATQIVVTVPIDAAEGAVTFNTLANQSVQSAALALVKPAITDISPASVIAGDKVTIAGTDFDLVTGLTVGGISIDKADFVSQTETQIVVNTLTSCIPGTDIIVLTTTNGSQVKSTQSVTINTPNIPAVTSITPSPVTVGNMISIVGTKLNLVESIVFKNNQGSTTKATQYGSRTETLIEVYVPSDALAGTVTLTMNAYDGTQYTSPSFVVKAVETDLWTGSIGPITWDTADGTVPVDASMMTAGQTLGVDFVCDPSAGYWQMQVMAGSWWTVLDNWPAVCGDGTIKSFGQSDTNIEFVITQNDINNIPPQGNGLFFAGNGIIIKRLYVKD